MTPEPDSTPAWLQNPATLLYLVLAGATPIVFIPVPLIDFPTITSEIVLVKDIFIRLVGGLILLLGALAVLIRGFAPLLQRPLITLTVLVYTLGALVSAAASGNMFFSLRYFWSEAMLLGALLLVPYFFHSQAQIRWGLYAALFSCFACALYSWVVYFTDGEALTLVYGANIRELLLGGGVAGAVIEGGTRGIYVSTLGNPEFTGTFLAVGIILSLVLLWNGWGTSHWPQRSWLSLPLGFGALVVIAFAVLLTQTRGSFLVVLMAGVVGYFSVFRLSAKLLALLAVVLGMLFLFLGPIGVLLWGLLVLLFPLGAATANGSIRGLFQRLSGIQRSLFLLGVLAAAVMVISAVTVPPLKTRLAPLVERFASATDVNDRSVRERLMFYTLAAEMAMQSPLFGVGPGMYPANFHTALVNLVEEDASGVMATNQLLLKNYVAFETHNDYFQILSEQGLWGILLFLLLIAGLLQPVWHAVRLVEGPTQHLALALLLSILGYLVMMLTSFPMQEPARSAHFFALLMFAYAFSLVIREPLETPSSP
jgi:hypothetical protein